jgi:hypothetical protein
VFKSGGTTESPNTTLYLDIAGKQTRITKVGESLANLNSDEFKDRGIPKTALLACSGWWAGQGDVFYLARKGSKDLVYQESQDEQAPKEHFRLVKTINR